MGIRKAAFALSLLPTFALAEGAVFQCFGEEPDWSLTIEPEQSYFRFGGREGWLDIPQSSVAEGAEWPKAMTIVGPRDSAIVLVNENECGTSPFEAHVLTQRGETPILLTGCCVIDD